MTPKHTSDLLSAMSALISDLESIIRHNRKKGNKRTVTEAMLRGMECHVSAARAVISEVTAP